jgi:hypothetical protein
MTTRPPLHLVVAATLAVALAAPLARAQSTPPAETASAGFAPTADAAGAFGVVGQLALSLGATNGPYLTFQKHGDWTLEVAPAADYFLFPHISVGGVVDYRHDSNVGAPNTSGQAEDTFSIGARAGYALALNDRFSVWPLLGLRLDYRSQSHTSSTNTFLPIYVPALFHPAPHLFVGLGPNVDVHLSGNRNFGWGIGTILGGWL